jgi:hypothetical protein
MKKSVSLGVLHMLCVGKGWMCVGVWRDSVCGRVFVHLKCVWVGGE